jgi:hypothetical protein
VERAQVEPLVDPAAVRAIGALDAVDPCTSIGGLVSAMLVLLVWTMRLPIVSPVRPRR